MTTNKLISKSAFILVVLLIAGVSSANIRVLLWDDPWCNTFSSDGTCCLKCSDHCYMDKCGKCQPVSDFCKTWDNCTGKCTSCFPGYGNPVNGVCSSTPVACNISVPAPVDDHCAKYGYVDAKSKIYNDFVKGCKKVCIQCDCDYYLNCDYQCIALPPYCTAADKWGNCTCCQKGYHLDCGKCVKDTACEPIVVVDHCIQYGYLDSSSKWLSVWSCGCKKVCKVCDCDYYLTCNYTCAPLPKNCKSADIYGNCTDCVKGYHVECGKCVADPDDHCAVYGWIDSASKWYTSETKGCQKVCKCCDKGYYLDCNHKCVKLPAHCNEVDSKGKCTKCCDGFILDCGKCVVDDHCEVYGWVDAANKWYNSETKGCKKVCKCCDKGYYLNCDNKCVKLPDNCQEVDKSGKCTKCCDGYKFVDGVCKVDDHCKVYGYIDAKKNWLTAYVKGCQQVCKCCDDGFYLDNNYKC